MVSNSQTSDKVKLLTTPLQYIKGVGPVLAEKLKAKNLFVVEDLLNFYPRVYRDQSVITDVRTIEHGQYAVIQGEIYHKKMQKRRHGGVYTLVLKTKDLHFVSLKYFKLPYRGFFEAFEVGQSVCICGHAVFYKDQMEFHHPHFLPETHSGGITPVYSEIEGVSQKKVRKILEFIFETFLPKGIELGLIPESIRKNFDLMNVRSALQDVHFPHGKSEDYLQVLAPSQRTLIFEEFFLFQLYLMLRRQKLKEKKSIPFQCEGKIALKYRQSLPFQWTSAQTKAFSEILSDLEKSYPMQRLIQGDVGSGKTSVAFQSFCYAFESKVQSAFMVPTEILAAQHFEQAQRWLEPLGMRVQLLSSRIKNKNHILQEIREGACDLCIGTHAMIQESVEFKKLGLVVIDEQHRFGVQQRRRLVDKGLEPHCLVMSATPIPRTLSMILYGDLDICVIDEKPQGRKPVITRKTNKRKEVFSFLAEEVAKGRRAYVVYPLVEESEKMDLKNATLQFEKLKKSFPQIKWGLLHGKMSAEDKYQTMSDFVLGKTQVLVATTVIEVGVDVPQASVIVIEHSERFGLSQLHQLRGRVGRGEFQSYCILIIGDLGEGNVRAEIMEKYSSGFDIAEEDLKLRGGGEIFGTKQSGSLNFKMARPARDIEILRQARRAAEATAALDPSLKNPEHSRLKQEIEKISKIRHN